MTDEQVIEQVTDAISDESTKWWIEREGESPHKTICRYTRKEIEYMKTFYWTNVRVRRADDA